MEEIVELRFKYTEDEYVLAYRQYLLAQKRSTFSIGIALVLIVVGIYLLLSGGDVALTVSFIGTGSFFFGLLFTSAGIMPRRRFRTDARFKSEFLLRFSRDGIEFHTNDIDAKIKWGIYKKTLETKKFYFLSDGASTLTVIPKRAFTNADQESVFRKLLDTKV